MSDYLQHEVHPTPFNVYATVFGALVVLTVITVGAAQVNFGNFNFVIAMLIASVKATLVALYFMHLKHENPITWMYAGIPVILILLMLLGLFIDTPTRPMEQFEQQREQAHTQDAAPHH